MNPPAEPLDSRIEIVTPENIAFEYQLAGPFRRLPAYLLDLLIYGMVLLILAMFSIYLARLIGFTGGGVGVTLVAWFFLGWFYDALFESLWNGQTPGKRLMSIRVLGIDGQPVTGMQAVLRSVLRAADLLPMGYQFGLLAASCNERFQRLGDLAAGTMVVVEQRELFREPLRIAEPEALRIAAQLPPRLDLSAAILRVLAGYVARRKSLAWQRRVEIARHLAEPLRVRYGMPAGISYDQFLCALYHRAFIAETQQR